MSNPVTGPREGGKNNRISFTPEAYPLLTENAKRVHGLLPNLVSPKTPTARPSTLSDQPWTEMKVKSILEKLNQKKEGRTNWQEILVKTIEYCERHLNNGTILSLPDGVTLLSLTLRSCQVTFDRDLLRRTNYLLHEFKERGFITSETSYLSTWTPPKASLSF